MKGKREQIFRRQQNLKQVRSAILVQFTILENGKDYLRFDP
jgi:hypothetical protein